MKDNTDYSTTQNNGNGDSNNGLEDWMETGEEEEEKRLREEQALMNGQNGGTYTLPLFYFILFYFVSFVCIYFMFIYTFIYLFIYLFI